MKSFYSLVAFALIGLGSTGCKATGSSSGSDASSGGSSSSMFTAAQIQKTWNSTCVAQVDARLGTTYYKSTLTLNSNLTFSYTVYLYTNPTGSEGLCSNADYTTIFFSYGSYAVGNYASGSTSLQQLNFNSNSAQVMISASGAQLTNTQNAFNNDCGGTSPYCTLSGGTCTNNGVVSGHGETSTSMLCMNYKFPSSTGTVVSNVARYSGGTLTLGAMSTGVPGVFPGQTVPTTATIVFN
jgi:hypothetical protein